MRKLKELVAADAVDPSLRHDLTGELAMLVQEAVATAGREGAGSVTPDDLSAYAAQKHAERMDEIVDATADSRSGGARSPGRVRGSRALQTVDSVVLTPRTWCRGTRRCSRTRSS